MKKQERISFTGGSRIGAVNETFPFSKLIIAPQKLRLKTTFSGSLEFSSNEIVAVVEVNFVPFLARGIKIVHQKPGYKENVIFWSLKDPKKIIRVLKEKGPVTTGAQTAQVSEARDGSNSDSSKRIKFLTSPLFFSFIAAMLLFAGFVEYKARNRYDNYTRTEKASGYRVEVKKMTVDHGVAFLNDSIIVPAGTKLVSEKPAWFKHNSRPLFRNEYPIPPSFDNLEPPFNLVKDPDSFKLQVIKYGDTVIFQIPDPDFKDPRDPSFGDLYDELFGN